MPVRTANLMLHTYRAGNKFGGNVTKRTPGAAYMGYFERREYDGSTRWHWSYAPYASQDRKAARWVYNELLRLGEQLAA